ncbi:hypothetical protein PJ985_12265 [Streptomyces sp. ACA25]|uniref:hypothetical protein n=1 Tax=Streptomyces sp. ACA25 TaxID=3022596 RepID=UPI0023077FEB|nr:hypothetical protein [Streptomyces sp. ACA25]MDB1088340.1 hypothetical protein [Streptomyces sp. ACA25]
MAGQPESESEHRYEQDPAPTDPPPAVPAEESVTDSALQEELEELRDANEILRLVARYFADTHPMSGPVDGEPGIGGSPAF